MLRLLLFILSLLLVISISFGVIINVSNCGILDQAYPGTEYRLNQSISISGVCLTLNTNPIYLDCQNYNITGDGTLRGIDVTVSADGSIIKNCNIYDFQIGLFISSADDTIVDNLSIYNSSFGFYLFQQYNLTINNSYVENTSYGVFLDSNSDNNKIYNSNFM
ncbi:MAG: right-handed parallel beta-helix repeat-containing protein, partial [Nanoarchaeota archaeon]|nr:right-handed parallel beta-helix repeat-containing protein [Nanoarchaeota archaeon]